MSDSTATTPRDNLVAALFVVVGMFMIASNDAIMKLSSSELGVGQLLFVRGCFATLLFSFIIKLSGRPVLPRNLFAPMNGLRGLCECAATVCFITALTLLPIAIASSLVWITPLLLTLSAAIFLKERVTFGRWLAVIAGFSGVLLVTNPFGADFSPAMLLPIMAAVFVCVRDLITRRLDTGLDSLHVLLVTLVLVTLVGFVMSLADWRPIHLTRAGWLCVSALLLGGGFLLQIRGMRLGELSFIAPFSYVGILASVFYGYVVWNELPNVAATFGILLIVGSGIFILGKRPRRLMRRRSIQ